MVGKRVAKSMSTPLTIWIDKIIANRKDQAKRMNVHPVSEHKFKVQGSSVKESLVDISYITCNWRVFLLDLLIYAYAIAGFQNAQVDYIGLYSYFYSKEQLLKGHAIPINPVGDITS